ncbi:MAG TPA: hypothetical protein VEZ17_07885 [Chitinophagaceae bacterium]|jgi:hypothetical protein|nr:hypothetical protein [Chitinophagaceae bacterium]
MIKYESFGPTEIDQIDLPGMSVKETPKKFVPHGAIAFFVALMVLCLAIWFGIYFLMLGRT